MSQDMFDLPWPQAKHGGRGEGDRATKEKPSNPADVVWKRVGGALGGRPKCDPCVHRMILGGKWFAPDPVTWERTGHGSHVYLCYWHASPLRAREGLIG